MPADTKKSRKAIRPPSMTVKDFRNYDKSSGGGKFKAFKIKYGFVQPPDTIADVRFMTDGEDEYQYRGFTHEVFSGTKNFRQFLCLNDINGKGDCPACKKGVPRKFFAVCVVYLKSVKDFDGNIIEVQKTDKGDNIKMKGFKYWLRSQAGMRLIDTKKAIKGLKGRYWSSTRTGSTMNDTSYDLEGNDPSKFKIEVTKKKLAFFFEHLDSLTKSSDEIKKLIKGWRPKEDGDLMPEDEDDSGGEDSLELEDMDRNELKKLIRKRDPDTKFKKSQTDDDLREIIEGFTEDDDDDDLDEDDL